MDLVNLTLGELLAILLPLSGIVVALYFYDRSRRRQVVSTLRFWPQRPAPPMVTRRKKLQQPLSLLLQLLALLLLFLAIADLRSGSTNGTPRHHVLILETSAWMNAALNDQGSRILMDLARERARDYLRAIPSGEPVMLILADGNPAPATPFTTDRAHIQQAINNAQPGWTAVDLASSFKLARSAVLANAGGSNGSDDVFGEIAFVGSGRITSNNTTTPKVPYLRFVQLGGPVPDTGVQRFVARRSTDQPDRWELVLEISHRGGEERPLRLDFLFEQKLLGSKEIRLGPNASEEISFRLRTRRSGLLEARLMPGDRLTANDRAGVFLPAFTARKVHVYSNQPANLRTLLTANPRLHVEFHRPADYTPAMARGVLSVFDGFAPEQDPEGDAVYLDPPASTSPVRVTRRARDVGIAQWNPAHPLARGLRSRDVVLSQASVFDAGPADVVAAESEAGPIIVARLDGDKKRVYFGFHPAAPELHNRLMAPLLFANTMGWLIPEAFRSSEVVAQSPGLVEIPVGGESEESIVITSPENPDLPWTLREDRLRFYAGSPGTVTVRTASRETRMTLSLPEPAPRRWNPPQGTLLGIPPPASASPFRDPVLWPWLVAAALICLLVEWRLFGRSARSASTAVHLGPSKPPAEKFPVAGAPRARKKEVAL